MDARNVQVLKKEAEEDLVENLEEEDLVENLEEDLVENLEEDIIIIWRSQIRIENPSKN